MKTKYKYLLLVIVTILASVFIYNYVEENTPVDDMENLLKIQNNINNEILNDTNYSIENPKVILNPYKISPLTALIVFKTNDLASVTVTIKGKNDDDIVNTFVPSKEHILPIYGLYPDYENTIIIKASSSEKMIKIKTGKLPAKIKNADAYESNENDFYFTTSTLMDGYPICYDKNGNVRWYLTRSFSYDFTNLENGYILIGNNVLMKDPYYSSGLVEMDLLGKIYYEYNVPGGYYKDVYEKSDGNLLLLSNDFNSNSKEDVIVEVDRNTGDIIKSFDLAKLFNEKGNWINLNSLYYDPKTNSITCVGDNKDQIINIDYATGEINWIIAVNIDSKFKKFLLSKDGNGKYPSKPHSVILTEEGNIAFISSINNEEYLLIYNINTVDRTFKEVKSYNLGSSGNSTIEYDNNEFIITTGSTIKKLSGNELTTIMKTSDDLYSTKTRVMYAGDMYLRDNGIQLGHTGITKTTDDHSVIIHKNGNNIIKKYNLQLKVDSKRLMVKGTFKESDKVQIILDNVLSKKTYDVDVLNGHETKNNKFETSTYINKEGVYGKYYIYLKVNGVNYKLNKYVIMS